MKLSVIICTCDRYDLASTAVASVVASAGFDSATMEVVVVDNTPSPRRSNVEFDPARLVVCDELGLSRARNTGIAAAKGEIVAFLDDDARAQDGWCTAIVSSFARFPKAQAIGGKTTPHFASDDLPKWYYPELAGYYSCLDWGDAARPLNTGEWIVGANMAFRAATLARFNGFDVSLGRKGAHGLLSNEETALMRAIGLDHIYYVPEMLADHLVPHERLSVAWLRKRVFWQAVSDALSGELWTTPAEAARELRNLVASSPAEFRGLKLFRFAPRAPAELRDQLRAIYLQAVLMSDGFDIGEEAR
ncbi:MAG: glycosyltransferase family 2 protein [Hyphomonadaceae bacterium]|nr:glycosyltransferase family 2 protein [Hyphomonadaceae bacterium]